ncbi:MAG: hypothetical protein HQ542_13685, partial [Bacteroidia bacterium]|nr:hypothetical protein [Bacteroidia bacterium]
RIGIGTITASYAVDVEGDGVVDKLRLRRYDGSENVHTFYGDGSGNMIYYNSAGNRGHQFYTNDGVTVSPRIRISPTGQLGIGTMSPATSSALEINSTTRGFLLPRMTQAQMEAVASPAAGLHLYNTDLNTLCIYNGTQWDCMDAQSWADRTFLCGNMFKDTRDGKIYPTVQIGDQCWIAENMNIGTRIDGGKAQTDNDTIEKYCYSNLDANCLTYGGLYQWDEVMQFVTTEGTQGICPYGWHIPTDAEYTTLTNALGGTDVAGGKVKQTGTILWLTPNTGATNSSGFTARPGGYRTSGGLFSYLGERSYSWSTTSYSPWTNSWNRAMIYNSDDVTRFGFSKVTGLSVRCIFDQ